MSFIARHEGHSNLMSPIFLVAWCSQNYRRASLTTGCRGWSRLRPVAHERTAHYRVLNSIGGRKLEQLAVACEPLQIRSRFAHNDSTRRGRGHFLTWCWRQSDARWRLLPKWRIRIIPEDGSHCRASRFFEYAASSCRRVCLNPHDIQQSGGWKWLRTQDRVGNAQTYWHQNKIVTCVAATESMCRC